MHYDKMLCQPYYIFNQSLTHVVLYVQNEKLDNDGESTIVRCTSWEEIFPRRSALATPLPQLLR